MQYMQNNSAKVTLEAIDRPDKKLVALKDPLVAGLEHEQYVTSLIHNIYDAAYSVKAVSYTHLDVYKRQA